MNKTLRKSLLFFALVAAFANCRKKIYDDFYGRPGSLAAPMYQVLTDKGNFKNLLALIDKSGYKGTLISGAGYWTLFAANDDAFSRYFKDKGISGVNDIDSVTARAIVQYALVYNSFEKARLDDYQATANNTGWTPSAAFRRRTACYTGFYTDTAANNTTLIAIASNRNGYTFAPSEDNNKYITYFIDDYFTATGLTAADYNYFYPNSQYKGFNVAEAQVVNKDISAENGIIHEIDRVISPLPSIDEYIRTRPEYSSFRALLNRLNINPTVQYLYSEDATHRYQVLTGKTNSVYVKAYSGLLAYSPNNENFVKAEVNDGQKDCWTMFIPNNAAVDAYVKNVLCEYYPSLDALPIDVIADFLNSHLFPTAVWPTRFATTRNKLTEPARFDPSADVFDKKVLSNGFVYGTTKVQAADVFSTVFSKAYLNPRFTLMTRLLNATGLKLLIAKSNVPVDVFMIPDQVFSAAGYSYNASKDQYEYRATPTSAATTGGIFDKLARITGTCVFFEPYKSKVDNLSGADIVKSGDAAIEGEYIRFNNNTIVTAGLQDLGLVAKVDSVKIATNGKAYFINNIPFYTDKPIGTHIKNLGTAPASEYTYFWNYLSNSALMYNATTTEIIGVSGFSTVLVPKNSAIVQAVNDGLLPGTGTAPNKVPNFNPSDDANKNLVRKFLQYHILYNHTIVPDGNLSGMLETWLKNAVGTTLKVSVNNTPGAMTLTDNYNRTSNVIVSQSNNLSSRCVIHLLDNYLKYNDN